MPLFDHKPVPSAHIVPSGNAPLNKDQKAFNALIKKLEARRARLSEWEAALPPFRQKCISELLPLQDACVSLQAQLARELDKAHARKGLTKSEKRKVSLLIVERAEMVLAEEDHSELKALFKKHSGSDFDELQTEGLDEMKAMLESVLGVELGDDFDPRSPEELLKQVETRFQAQQEDAAGRKKSRREEARAARQEAEEKQLSQSIREVFRKLASALHPDREIDPAEKARKTALMQRANQAYEEGNLLQLLELQLELEHIDQAHLSAIRPERLKHYLKILKGQLNDLDMEIQLIEEQLIIDCGLPPYGQIQPGDLLPILEQDLAACQEQILVLRNEIAFLADLKQLKAWLRFTSPHDPDFDMPF